MLNRIDKEILRLLLKYKEHTLTVNQIAKKVQISSRTAKKHIDKLAKENYVFIIEKGKPRNYRRKDGKTS